MITQNELRHGLKHRHHHGLTHARLTARVERSRHGIDRVESSHAISQCDGGICGFRHSILTHEPWHTGRTLYQIIVGRPGCIGPVLIKAAATDMNNARVALLYRFEVESQSSKSLRPHVADEDVATLS